MAHRFYACNMFRHVYCWKLNLAQVSEYLIQLDSCPVRADINIYRLLYLYIYISPIYLKCVNISDLKYKGSRFSKESFALGKRVNEASDHD